MSWLKPEARPGGYDPQLRVEKLILEFGNSARRILDALNGVDPLHVFYGENVDEYVSYVKRFCARLGGRTVDALTEQEIVEFMSEAFENSRLSEEELHAISRTILGH